MKKMFRSWQLAYNYMMRRKEEKYRCYMAEFWDEDGAYYYVYWG